MRCFGCHETLDLAAGERVGFRDTCPRCDADLHVCLNCAHHDPSSYNECREPNAERVLERERANRCEYFTPSSAAAKGGATDPERSRRTLDALFRKDS